MRKYLFQYINYLTINNLESNFRTLVHITINGNNQGCIQNQISKGKSF